MTNFKKYLDRIKDSLDSINSYLEVLEEEKTGLLQTIYLNGKFLKTTTLTKIRETLNGDK